MTAFAARFVGGGAIIAALPLLAARFGPSLAAAVMIAPVLTLVGLAGVGAAVGAADMAAVALRGVMFLPLVAVFLLAVYVLASRGWAPPAVLTAAAAVWFAAAVTILNALTPGTSLRTFFYAFVYVNAAAGAVWLRNVLLRNRRHVEVTTIDDLIAARDRDGER